MKFNEIKSTLCQQFAVTNKITPFIEGRPGGGKSACAREVAMWLKEQHNIADEQIVEFNPSLRDPVDVMGIPFKSADGSHSEWLPPQEFYALRDGVGPCVLIIEELSDAPMAMQNPMCRIILDRYAGQLKLSDELYIICTGNRVEDRSGANRMSTKLGNRLRVLEFNEDVEDWINWAKKNGIDDILIKFINFDRKLLSDFDPTRKTNPTPRAWEKVSYIPEFENDPEQYLFTQHVAGDVGEGAAITYVAFRKMYKSLPDFKELLQNPKTYPVPKELSVAYATVMKLIDMMVDDPTKKTISAILTFIYRVQPEIQGMAVREMMKAEPKARMAIIGSPEFAKMAKSLNTGI